MREELRVNFNNLKSIKENEKKKGELENKGFSLVSMKPFGYDKFIMVYEK